MVIGQEATSHWRRLYMPRQIQNEQRRLNVISNYDIGIGVLMILYTFVDYWIHNADLF